MKNTILNQILKLEEEENFLISHESFGAAETISARRERLVKKLEALCTTEQVEAIDRESTMRLMAGEEWSEIARDIISRN